MQPVPPDKDKFIAEFQARLKWTRERLLGWTHKRMATALGISEETYKKYENREGSAFPLYLLPTLIVITDQPYSYWTTGQGGVPKRLKAVK